MACNKKQKDTCGTKTPASCVYIDTEVPEFSNLYEEPCKLVVEETTEDLYDLIESIRMTIDLKDFDKGCLEINKVKDPYDNTEKYLVKDILTALKNKVCTSNSSEQNIEFILENLNYKCLVLPCDSKPKNLFQFFQLLIDKHCNE